MRALDTAYNYRRFTSHRTLARVAGDLLGEFTISTKVGFFPDGAGRTRHSLRPQQLRDAIAQLVEDLGRVPSVIFLHNPERVFFGEMVDPSARLDDLTEACVVLHNAVTDGLCTSWGWSTWDSRPLSAVLAGMAHVGMPGPQVMMLRAGLLVPSQVLDAGERLAEVFRLGPSARWGMSPFAGRSDDPVWDVVNPLQFLAPLQQSTRLQAVARVAFAAPEVDRLAVGTDDPAHLDELLAATELELDHAAVTRYRSLLRHRAAITATP